MMIIKLRAYKFIYIFFFYLFLILKSFILLDNLRFPHFSLHFYDFISFAEFFPLQYCAILNIHHIYIHM